MLFLATLIAGTLIVVSSSSWLGCWIGLEINLLSFIPLIYNLSRFASESALKYFLVQALASSTLLLFILLSSYYSNLTWGNWDFGRNGLYLNYLIASSLFLKIGAAPFHFWFPVVAEGLDWDNLIILITWQKIAPFILISYVLSTNLLFMIVIVLSTLFGALGGVNQTSLRKIIAYSSINHMGWIVGSFIMRESLWLTYFFIYSLLRLTVIIVFKHFNVNYLSQIFGLNNIDNQTKLVISLNLLSIGGLPPFLGFLPKWLVIQNLVRLGFTPLVTWIVIISLITLFFYTRVRYSALLLTHSELKWAIKSPTSVPNIIMVLSSVSLFGLIFCSLGTLII